MSMIGLLTTATQTTGAKTATDDAVAAEGFGSALRGALAALAGAANESKPEESASLESVPRPELVEIAAGTAPAASTLPLAELVETATASGDPASAVTSSSAAPELVELVGRRTDPVEVTVPSDQSPDSSTGEPVAASTLGQAQGTASSASGPSQVEPVDTPTGNSLPDAATSNPVAGSTLGQAQGTANSATGTPVPVSALPLVGLVEVATGSVAPAGTASSADAAPVPVSALPLVELVERRTEPAEVTPTGNALPASTPTAGTAVSVESSATSSMGRGSASESARVLRSPQQVSATPATAAAGLAAQRTLASTNSTSGNPQSSPNAEAGTVQAPTAVAAPTVPTVSSPAPVAAAAAAAPAASVPLTAQLARPIFSLAAAGAGDHVMTVSVTPDNLGPVTVRAHVGAEGVRVELFAPNDLGRDAIRAIITDLRRDLAGAGLGGNLTLSSHNQPSANAGAGQSGTGQPGSEPGGSEGGPARDADVAARATTDASAGQEASRPRLFGTSSTIDVMA